MKRRGFLQGLVALVAARPALEAMATKLSEDVEQKAEAFKYDPAKFSVGSTLTFTIWS